MYMMVHDRRSEALAPEEPSYFYFPERLQKWIPANEIPPTSSTVHNFPMANNARKLRAPAKKGQKRNPPLRRQENSLQDLEGAIAVYLKEGGIVMDFCCGTAVSGLAALRVGAHLIFMNDRDQNVVAHAKERARQYKDIKRGKVVLNV